ncbi:LysR family transcriptional regulator [Streptomyces sp. NPDC006798]|uniref:LysR family transcriptional regulator n=1 Tax=Streptomyces sp. NPDC006798 TaxID=3155462 RepID=UPI0033E5040A
MDLSTVELRHLRGFLAVADELNFTHAAARLGIGQPALTRTVRALEESLGARLLARTTRSVELTDAGRRLRDELTPLLGGLDSALRGTADGALLRLGFTAQLPAVCAGLTAAFERATGAGVRLVRKDTPLAGLDAGACDIAVVRGEIPPEAPVRSRVLLHEPRMAVVARDGTRLTGRRVVEWTELAHLPLVVDTVTGTTHPGLWPSGHRPELACHADNVDEWLESVAAGHGVGIATEPVIRRLRHPNLRPLRLKNAPRVAVRLAIPARNPHPLAERYLLDATAVATATGGATSTGTNTGTPPRP